MCSICRVFLCFLCILLFVCFQDRVSLCSCGCPGTHYVDLADFELTDLPASASQVLGLAGQWWCTCLIPALGR